MNIQGQTNQFVSYPKSALDRIIELLDALNIKGNMVSNAQVVAAIVQILQSQGTVQTEETAAQEDSTIHEN